MDNAILQTAFDVRDEDVSQPTVFVTMDTNLRIRADALGMLAETYENQRVEPKAARHRRHRDRGLRRGDRRVLPGRQPRAERCAHRARARREGRALREHQRRHGTRGSSPRTPASSSAIARTRRTPRSAATTRRKREIIGAPHAARGRDRHPPAQQGAEPRARPPARREHPPRHARRQGRHRQDAARARGGPQAHGRGRHVHAHARLAPGHAARPRHRLPARATSTRS